MALLWEATLRLWGVSILSLRALPSIHSVSHYGCSAAVCVCSLTCVLDPPGTDFQMAVSHHVSGRKKAWVL